MTREEAIELLEKSKHNPQPYEYMSEAIDMAIKALEAEPCEDLEREYEKSKALFHKVVAEDDCISRKAALNLFNKSDECRWEISWIRRKIEKLPSVTPTIPEVENNYNIGYNCGYADAMSDVADMRGDAE